jgi:hypothetical protein
MMALAASYSYSGLAPQRNDDAISTLMQSFADAAKSGKPLDHFLAPSVSPTARDKESAYASKPFTDLKFTNYELPGGLHFADQEHAEMTLDVEWSTKHSNFKQTATIHFVRVNGMWYFNDFQFLRFNWAFALGGAVLAIAWALLFLRMLFDWRKRKFRTTVAAAAWLLALFFPVFGAIAYWGVLVRPRSAT